MLQRCLSAGECTGAQQWQQLLQQGWLWPLALTHRWGAAGAEGCPASWLGVQSSHAERAVARRSVGPGADLIGPASSPPPMLHLGVRVCLSFFSCLFLFYSLLLSVYTVNPHQ